MNQPHLSFVVASLCLGICSHIASQVATPPEPPNPDSVKRTDVPLKPGKEAGEFWRAVHFSGGQLTIPFKIRPKKEHGTFRLTTDVTLGAYLGFTKCLSKAKGYSLTVPLTAGLTFININDDNTSTDLMASRDGGANVVPGLSWSSGIVLQLEKFNVGIIFGKDYASEVGDQWIYHGKLWWSFGLGFSFLQ